MAIVAVCSHQADASSHRPRSKDNSCHSSLLYSSCWLWWYLWVSRNSPAAASVSVTQGKTPGDCWTSEHVYKWAVPSAFYIYWCEPWELTGRNHQIQMFLVLVSHFCLLWGRCLHKCLWGPSHSHRWSDRDPAACGTRDILLTDSQHISHVFSFTTIIQIPSPRSACLYYLWARKEFK